MEDRKHLLILKWRAVQVLCNQLQSHHDGTISPVWSTKMPLQMKTGKDGTFASSLNSSPLASICRTSLCKYTVRDVGDSYNAGDKQKVSHQFYWWIDAIFLHRSYSPFTLCLCLQNGPCSLFTSRKPRSPLVLRGNLKSWALNFVLQRHWPKYYQLSPPIIASCSEF